jgi:single-strand DNA-binding protein
MSTTITFAGNLAEDPELLHARDEKPFVSCRALVTNRTRNADGKWVDGEPTAHNVKVYGTAALNLYDSAGRGERVIVHGLMNTETWTDGVTQQNRTKQVVEVSNRVGEVGGSFNFAAARIERQRPATTSMTVEQPAAADPTPVSMPDPVADPAAG